MTTLLNTIVVQMWFSLRGSSKAERSWLTVRSKLALMFDFSKFNVKTLEVAPSVFECCYVGGVDAIQVSLSRPVELK